MADSVYKVIELVGSSDKSWEEAAKNAVEIASKSLKVVGYRARVSLSFKYED